MQDRSISVSVSRVATVTAWVLTWGLVACSILFDDLGFAAVGLAMSAASATLSMRGYCVQLQAGMQSAFELGRDMGRSEVSSIRR